MPCSIVATQRRPVPAGGRPVGPSVPRGALMRILAVAEVPKLFKRDVDARFERIRCRAPLEAIALEGDCRQAPRDRGVILGRVGEGLAHQLVTKGETGTFVDRRQQTRVVARIDDDEHVAKVLGSRAHHAGTANIDLLEEPLEFDAFSLRRLHERIEVDDDDVDRLDAELGEHLEVVGMVATRKNAAVDCGMERLHAALHHLGKARHLRDARHRQAGLGQLPRGAAGRDQREPARDQAAPEIGDAGLVGDAQEGSWHNQ